MPESYGVCGVLSISPHGFMLHIGDIPRATAFVRFVTNTVCFCDA